MFVERHISENFHQFGSNAKRQVSSRFNKGPPLDILGDGDVDMLLLNSVRASLAPTVARVLPYSTTRLLTTSSLLLQKAVEESPIAVTSQMLKIVPNDADTVALEKQDQLIKRRRKLAFQRNHKIEEVETGIPRFEMVPCSNLPIFAQGGPSPFVDRCEEGHRW